MTYLEIAQAQLPIDEGVISHAYQDSLGFWTIGVGRLIDQRRGGKLSEDEIALLLKNDIAEADKSARAVFPAFDSLSEPRKAVLVNMAFNLGQARLAGFVNTLRALADGRYDDAADGMLASKWAVQVGARAHRLAGIMRAG
ncbi:MAG: glycoside hydrolase family protein [Gallionella sp.]|nr:glycoside hydrolase family protein [Gallionella sp.]